METTRKRKPEAVEQSTRRKKDSHFNETTRGSAPCTMLVPPEEQAFYF
jgi:hypothetical protein